MTVLDEKFECNQQKEIMLPSGPVLLMCIPKHNLYVVTDVGSFAGNWIQVRYRQNVYDCRLMTGQDPTGHIVAVARFLAQTVIQRRLAYLDPRTDPAGLEMRLQFNIALRDCANYDTVRHVRQEFEKLFAD